MNDKEIVEIIAHAIDRVRAEEPPLDFNIVHERSTAHRLAVQMESEFPGWNLDCEYNRSEQMHKLLAGIQECSEERSTDRIFPDIIVHHRGTNGAEHNLLVVEMKRNSEQDRCDFLKLCGLTDPSKPFGYQLGVYININHGRFETTWFKNGATIPQP